MNAFFVRDVVGAIYNDYDAVVAQLLKAGQRRGFFFTCVCLFSDVTRRQSILGARVDDGVDEIKVSIPRRCVASFFQTAVILCIDRHFIALFARFATRRHRRRHVARRAMRRFTSPSPRSRSVLTVPDASSRVVDCENICRFLTILLCLTRMHYRPMSQLSRFVAFDFSFFSFLFVSFFLSFFAFVVLYRHRMSSLIDRINPMCRTYDC
jgi:hypothetical protein